jgi:hypothetical protein
MSEDILSFMFWLGTISVLPFWTLVIFFPRRPVTQRMMKSPLVLVLTALIQAAFIIMILPNRPDLKDDYSALLLLTPSKILAKMAEPDIATASWLHMLPGDLFIGQWIYLDSRKRNLSPWLVSPTLFLTCMSGSIGFILYLIVAATNHTISNVVQSRSARLDNPPD